MDLDILYRLTFIVGFLTAGFLALAAGLVSMALFRYISRMENEMKQLMDDAEEQLHRLEED